MTASDEPIRPTIGAVIVNFNAGPLILRAIEAVLASALPTEVIVSDNGSTDDSLERVAECAALDPRIRILRNGANLGFSRANNAAFRQSRGDFLLVLNPDCVPLAGAIETVLEVLGANPQAGMAGCLIENPDGTEQQGCRRRLPTPLSSLAVFSGLERIWPRLVAHQGVHMNQEALPSGPVAVEAISGAFMLVRRQALEAVGPFDEGYFLHGEDLDWCARFALAGWQILFVPQARAVHFQGTCSRERPLFVLWHKHRSMVRFFRKFQSERHSLPFNGLVIAGIWSHFALRAVAGSIARLWQGWAPR